MDYHKFKIRLNDIESILISAALIIVFAQSCSDSKTDKQYETTIERSLLFSDSIPVVDLIGNWSLKDTNHNVRFKSFVIDSNGLHNITDTNIWHYKLSIEGKKLMLGSERNQNLITYYTIDTLTVYWNSGEYVTYIRDKQP